MEGDGVAWTAARHKTDVLPLIAKLSTGNNDKNNYNYYY